MHFIRSLHTLAPHWTLWAAPPTLIALCTLLPALPCPTTLIYAQQADKQTQLHFIHLVTTVLYIKKHFFVSLYVFRMDRAYLGAGQGLSLVFYFINTEQDK